VPAWSVPARNAGPTPATGSLRRSGPAGLCGCWPSLVLATPAAAEVWSEWVSIAQKTGFGPVSPLPGIWPLDSAIILPVGVEAYAAYALRGECLLQFGLECSDLREPAGL
jgi:hypothetical protein